MYSTNSAYKVGREIGRSAGDLWVPDELIWQQIRRDVVPRIKLQKSEQDRAAESSAGLAIGSTMVGILGIAAATLALLPAGMLPPVQRQLSVLPTPLVLLVAVLLVAVAALAVVLHMQRRRRAREARMMKYRALREAAFRGAQDALERRRGGQGMRLPEEIRRQFPKPSPRRGVVTPLDAEQIVAQWMRHLGEGDAELTKAVGDGGIDVTGRWYIAQVKHYKARVGVAPIRELAGVVANDGRKGLFVTSTGYASGAIEFADQRGIALFVYQPAMAELVSINGIAKTLVYRGLG